MKNYSKISLFLISTVVTLGPTPANAETLQNLLNSFRSHTSAKNFKVLNADKTQFDVAANSSKFSAPTQLALKGDLDGKDFNNSYYEAVVRQKFLLGNSRANAERKFRSINEVQYLEKLVGIYEYELDISRTYIELREKKDLLIVLQDAVSIFDPTMLQAKAAVKTGAVNSIFFTRLQIYTENLKSDFAALNRDLESLSGALIQEAFLPDSTNLLKSDLMAISEHDFQKEFVAAAYIPLKSLNLKQDALDASASTLSSVREYEVGAGLAVKGEKKDVSYLVELAVPLGSSYTVSSEVYSISKERETLKIESEMAEKKAAQYLRKFNLNILKNAQLFKTQSKTVEQLESLLVRVKKAYGQGSQEATEYLEFYKELVEAKRKMFSARATQELSIVELHYFLQGGVK